MNFVNEVRSSTGDGSISFDTTGVIKGTPFTHTQFNAARTAVGSTTSHGTLPNTAAQGGLIYGNDHFGRLRDSINDAAETAFDTGDPHPGDYGKQSNEES